MGRNQCRGGFTLVELLVVIGIIGLLIGILLPVINAVRVSALESVCMSNMRQLGIGTQAYANRDRGWLPTKGPDGSAPGVPNSFMPGNYNLQRGYDDASIWFNAIPPLINTDTYYDMLVAYTQGIPLPHPNSSPSVFICPASGDIGTLNGNDQVAGDYFLLYGVDSTSQIKNSTGLIAAGEFPFAMSYVWNSKLNTVYPAPSADDLPPIKMSDLTDASNTIIMTEKLNNPGEYLDFYVQEYNNNALSHTVYNSVGQEITAQGFNKNIAQAKADYRRFTTRHSHGGNLLFADGHVAWFSWLGVQIQPDQLPFTPSSNVNHPGCIWCAIGPTQ